MTRQPWHTLTTEQFIIGLHPEWTSRQVQAIAAWYDDRISLEELQAKLSSTRSDRRVLRIGVRDR